VHALPARPLKVRELTDLRSKLGRRRRHTRSAYVSIPDAVGSRRLPKKVHENFNYHCENFNQCAKKRKPELPFPILTLFSSFVLFHRFRFRAYQHSREIYHYRKTDGGYQQVAEADIAIHTCPDAHFFLSAAEIRMTAFIAFHRHIQTFQLFYRIAHFLLHRAENFIEIRKNHILSEILFVFSISAFGARYVIFLSRLFSYKCKF
jgi:hypothetical protein